MNAFLTGVLIAGAVACAAVSVVAPPPFSAAWLGTLLLGSAALARGT